MILPPLGPFQCSFRRKQRRHQQQPGDLPTPREQGRPAGSPAPPHHVGVSPSGSAPRSPAGKLVATSKHARIPLLIVTVACFKTGKVSCSLACARARVGVSARWCPNQPAGLFGFSKREAPSARVNLRCGFSCGGNLRGCWAGVRASPSRQ